MMTITVRLSLIVIIIGLIITAILNIILIVMIWGIILKIRILLLIKTIITIIWTVMMIIIQGQANSERETWFNMVLSGSIWFSMVQYGSIWFSMVQYGSIWFNPPFSKIKSSNQPNVKSAISSHNRKILHSPVNHPSRTCNCINKTECLLQEKCWSENSSRY